MTGLRAVIRSKGKTDPHAIAKARKIREIKLVFSMTGIDSGTQPVGSRVDRFRAGCSFRRSGVGKGREKIGYLECDDVAVTQTVSLRRRAITQASSIRTVRKLTVCVT